MELDGESFPNKYSKQSVPKQSLVINIDIINTVFYSWFIEISVFVSNFLSAYLNFPFQGLDPQSRRTTIGVGSTVALVAERTGFYLTPSSMCRLLDLGPVPIRSRYKCKWNVWRNAKSSIFFSCFPCFVVYPINIKSRLLLSFPQKYKLKGGS